MLEQWIAITYFTIGISSKVLEDRVPLDVDFAEVVDAGTRISSVVLCRKIEVDCGEGFGYV